MTEPTPPTDAALFKALKELVVEAQAVADDHHRPRYMRLDQALASARNAMLDYWAATPQPTQAQAMTPPPIECDTEELRRAYAFGWWSALEKQRETAQAGAVPLTDEQIQDAILPINPHGMGYFLRIARAIEAAHGIGIKGGQHGAE